MKIEMNDKDKAIFDKISDKKKVEDDFIFRLRSSGIEYNRDFELHRRLLNDLVANTINIEEAIQVIASKKRNKRRNNSRLNT